MAPPICERAAEIGPYLRALFARYSGAPASRYDDLILRIQERGIEVFFATLNYETLLEEALQRAYGEAIHELDGYVLRGARGTLPSCTAR